MAEFRDLQCFNVAILSWNNRRRGQFGKSIFHSRSNQTEIAFHVNMFDTGGLLGSICPE